LRGFSNERKKNWYINVLDIDKGETYQANIRNICGERDFMRIDIEGYSPNHIENELSKMENECIEAIRRIDRSKKFCGEDANLTMNLMALLSVRSPEMRENMRDFKERVAKTVMGLTLATKERWESEMKQMENSGGPIRGNITYEEMKNFYERDTYTVSISREAQIKTEIQLAPEVLTSLGERLWTLYITKDSSGEFITTDRPVTLTYKNPPSISPMHRNSPGFGLPETEVYFPLTKNSLLVGRWDYGGHWSEEVITESADIDYISAVNTHMLKNSLRQIFSRERKIAYMDFSHNPRWDEELPNLVKSYRI
jgi:hypothetical protein